VTAFPVISFVLVAAVLTALALAWVLPPLLRRRRPGVNVERAESNVALLREQLAELDADLASGTLSTEKYAQARSELERRVLEESDSDPSPGEGSGIRGRRAAVALAVLIPVAAALLYLQIGSPGALSPQEAVPGHPELTMEQIEGMVARLESRLRENPDDADGWALLARSNLVLQRFPEAVKAYARATALVKDNASLYADYADAVAMAQGRRLQGEPERLIAQALKIDPDHVKALALAGTVAFEKKDFDGAIAHWERILKVAPPDSEILASVRDSIAEARTLGGRSDKPSAGTSKPSVVREPAAAPAGANVSGTVRLAPALAGKAAPTDIVFIFARAVSGPRMPLAVLRKQVRELPVEFRLDDSMAMAPTAKLSDQEKVVIGARISKGGGPVGQPGDLEGFSAPVNVGERGVAVVIDSEVR
jgi:cytochrome c-type biogenesis protein CcmH